MSQRVTPTHDVRKMQPSTAKRDGRDQRSFTQTTAMRKVARYLKDNLKTVAIIYINNDFGKGGRDVFNKALVSTSCNACFHATGAHYLNADTTAFMQCLTLDLFKDFPMLRFTIPHGGGAVPYHWGRFRRLAQELKSRR